MDSIILNGKEYNIKKDEFIIKPHTEYNNLKIYPKVGELERIIGLLNDLIENKSDASLLVYGWSYGGFVPIGCSKIYKNVYVNTNENIIVNKMPENIYFNTIHNIPYTIYINDTNVDITNIIDCTNSYVLCDKNVKLWLKNSMKFFLNNSNLVLYVPNKLLSDFNVQFRYYFDEYGNFAYDNLIHLCIMVKNAGPLFEKVLTDNLPIIDRWTILDTGSTDGTQDIIRKVLDNKKGQLYEEPFINFRESRNRCLELSGNNCKYRVMLDDTYAIKNDLRNFLNTIRGDQFGSSYSLLILSDDTEYYSNRVTISDRNMKYIYTIHEVIQYEGNKENVVIPKNAGYIHDYRAPYMEKRTMDRKQYDLGLLHDMVKEDPTNPRHYYYLAQTYNLLEDYENTVYWFKKRATTELTGHIQEAVDSWFELGRIYNFKLNRPWEECKHAYEESYKMDPLRPEALYFIGIKYFLENDTKTAYDYFKRAFILGYPIHAQFSLKPTLVYYFLPKFLSQLCYEFNDWQLGFECSTRFIENNKPDSDGYDVVLSWLNIYKLLCKLPAITTTINMTVNISEKQLIVFVADGGWDQWTGSDILTKGVGGSETYIIEIARWIQASNKYNCIVFCNCNTSETFEGVNYMSLNEYPEFIVKNHIHTVVISRYSEYVPLSIYGHIENIYLVLHDLGPSGLVIPTHTKIKKIICLTEWHKQHFIENFPDFKDRTESFYYGIDTNKFKPDNKVPNSFIYSSFPNRGLLPLLQMWPKIKKAIPDASLNIYSDINGKWVNDVAKEQMDEIHKILATDLKDVIVHGWVSKDILARAWSTADIWLYPCIFQETFCLTALEAAASKTLAIGTPLAALTETICDRGLLVSGNPLEFVWQDVAIKELVEVLSNHKKKTELIESNYKWATGITWQQRGEEFIKKYIEPDIATIATYTINIAGMYN